MTYLYRAVDALGKTLIFFLSTTRDAQAATHFLRTVLAAPHTVPSRVITADKNAAYPKPFKELKAEGDLPQDRDLRRVKYLNNILKQVHRFIKRLVKLGMGFFSLETVWRRL